MAIEKYIIDKSDLSALLKGEDLTIQPKGNIKGFCVEIAGNFTNGDVIKALFPNKQFVSVCSTRIYDFTTNNKIDCDLEWWNAPYKADKEKN